METIQVLLFSALLVNALAANCTHQTCEKGDGCRRKITLTGFHQEPHLQVFHNHQSGSNSEGGQPTTFEYCLDNNPGETLPKYCWSNTCSPGLESSDGTSGSCNKGDDDSSCRCPDSSENGNSCNNSRTSSQNQNTGSNSCGQCQRSNCCTQHCVGSQSGNCQTSSAFNGQCCRDQGSQNTQNCVTQSEHCGSNHQVNCQQPQNCGHVSRLQHENSRCLTHSDSNGQHSCNNCYPQYQVNQNGPCNDQQTSFVNSGQPCGSHPNNQGNNQQSHSNFPCNVPQAQNNGQQFRPSSPTGQLSGVYPQTNQYSPNYQQPSPQFSANLLPTTQLKQPNTVFPSQNYAGVYQQISPRNGRQSFSVNVGQSLVGQRPHLYPVQTDVTANAQAWAGSNIHLHCPHSNNQGLPPNVLV